MGDLWAFTKVLKHSYKFNTIKRWSLKLLAICLPVLDGAGDAAGYGRLNLPLVQQ
jgi:hypothetical protein